MFESENIEFKSEFTEDLYKEESDGDNFEQMTSLNQTLTFNYAEKMFRKYGVEFNTEKFKTLGLINLKSGNYTNLALLFSDQCPISVKVAVFADEECTEFRDSKEFKGSIFEQFENTLNYLTLCNRTVSEIKGVLRNDKKDYPDETIREALLNAITHRDYSFSGSIIINVTDSRMEFISIGGLIPGLTIDDIKIGISQTRNTKLADVLHRLHLVESYGTGIRRIFKLYEESRRLPDIEVAPNAFKITIYNLNVAPKNKTDKISYQMKEVIDYVRENDNANDAGIEALLNIKHTRSYILTREMIELGLIEAVGRGKNKRYIIPD